ncbi:hypothetical protein Q9L58_010131 [Maublancomyces gigas]|uniref:Ankyrin repeat protein n=1 Tax=Discina gigas TaxID=1032678 RepID=A0ABR3G5A0_9PEZI
MPNTALHCAAHVGNWELVMRLLDDGADIETQGYKRYTALHVAAIFQQTGVLTVLLARGANASAKDTEGLTALHHAAGEGHWKVVQILVVRGKADLEARDNDGNTPLHSAVMGSNAGVKGIPRVIKILLASGADKEAHESSGYRPLELSIGPDWEEIEVLLE